MNDPLVLRIGEIRIDVDVGTEERQELIAALEAALTELARQLQSSLVGYGDASFSLRLPDIIVGGGRSMASLDFSRLSEAVLAEIVKALGAGR